MGNVRVPEGLRMRHKQMGLVPDVYSFLELVTKDRRCNSKRGGADELRQLRMTMCEDIG